MSRVELGRCLAVVTQAVNSRPRAPGVVFPRSYIALSESTHILMRGCMLTCWLLPVEVSTTNPESGHNPESVESCRPVALELNMSDTGLSSLPIKFQHK